MNISSWQRESRRPPFAGMAQVPQARGALAKGWITNERARVTLVWKGTDATQNAKEMRVRVMATTTKGSPCVLFRGTSCQSETYAHAPIQIGINVANTSCRLRLPGRQCLWTSLRIGSRQEDQPCDDATPAPFWGRMSTSMRSWLGCSSSRRKAM